MKTLIVFLFLAINFFSCSFSALDYKSGAGSGNLATPTPTLTPAAAVICSEENYQPKSEAELAAMTSRQLIEEMVKNSPYSFKSYREWSDYEHSIDRKISNAGGVQLLPLLTEYINAFEPPSASACDRARFSYARRKLGDIDGAQFRLRGTTEGQSAIDAFEQAIERMEKIEVNKNTNDERKLYLDQIKGINRVDDAIHDTFLVKKKIKLSDKELLEFSNFLVERDPTYPTWSVMDSERDNSRIDEEGIAPEVLILEEPQRFYEAYQEFKETRR